MKWTIAMTQEELKRKTIIEQAVDKRILQREGAKKLGISERQFCRIISRYRAQGDAGLISGHRGKPSNHRLPESHRKQIAAYISDPIFDGFGPTLLNEKLREDKGITICKETLRQIMIEEGKHQPKVKRKKEPHPPRDRRCRRGELVQIDGSYHAWLEERGAKACLMLFVDDATSAVLAAEFVDQESFFAYGSLCKTYFKAAGIPVAFYSDKFSVFRANASRSIQKEAVTQFNRALGALGVELICANSPQAKGRVERANQTFQDRLVKEMRLRHIDNYQDANVFLPEFVTFYNQRFTVLPRSAGDVHAPLDASLDLDFLFSIHDTRTITKDLQIHFNTVAYQIVTRRPPQNLSGREVLIVQGPDGVVSAYLNHEKLTLKIFHKQSKPPRVAYSKSLDPQIYTPPVDHPWRTYGKKLNGKPVLVSDQYDISI
jgi:transposase